MSETSIWRTIMSSWIFLGHVVFSVPVFVSVEHVLYNPSARLMYCRLMNCRSSVATEMQAGRLEGVSSLKVISLGPSVITWRPTVQPTDFSKKFLGPVYRGSALLRFDKYTLQTLGFALIVLGIFLFMLGLIGGSTGTGPACPLNGCPPGPLPWYWWLPAASFLSGIALVIIGIILLIVARSMKPKQEVDTAITPTASS